MPIETPTLPAVPDYPTDGPHAAALETAHGIFLDELASVEGWEDEGERDGVQLYKKPDPNDAYAVPTVKGECLVENITSDAFLAVIQLPGMRKRWDSRFEDGIILQRYSRLSYAFYSVMKGMGWLVYPRDIVGVQKNYRTDEENKEIIIIQTSVEENDIAPEQPGKARATLTIGGWKLTPVGSDLRVTYLVQISLNGSIPLAMVNKIAVEIPLCTGRARDVYETLGHAPYVRPCPDQLEPSVIFQTESLSDPGATPADPGSLEYRCVFTTDDAAMFDIVYDGVRFYPGGVEVTVEGEGAEARVVEGVVRVKCSERGKVVAVVLSPK